MDLQELRWGSHRQECFGPGQEQVAGIFKHYNETSGFIKRGEYLD
jgi:hypothetical protein